MQIYNPAIYRICPLDYGVRLVSWGS